MKDKYSPAWHQLLAFHIYISHAVSFLPFFEGRLKSAMNKHHNVVYFHLASHAKTLIPSHVDHQNTQAQGRKNSG